MVCMSSRVTSRLVDKIVEEHDVDVLFWADELKKNLQVLQYICFINNNALL